MKILRTIKNELRKAYKALQQVGLTNTPDGIKLHRQWAGVTRKMNKLRLRLKKTEEAKERLRRERRFVLTL